MSTLLSVIAFLILSFVSFLFLWLVLAMVRACLRLFIPSGLGSLNARGIVIALGVTAVVFADTTNTIVRGPIALGIDAFVLFAHAAGNVMDFLMSDAGSGQVGDAILRELRVNAPELAGRARNLLYEISFPALAAAIAVFLMIANAISGTAESSLLLRLRETYKKIEPARRRRYGLAATLLAGSYLSLAAIVALPWLQIPGGIDPRSESEFRLQLEDVAGSEREFQQQWSVPLLQFEKLDALPDDFAAKSSELRKRVEKDFDSVNVAIDQLKKEWLRFTELASRERANLFEQAVETYQRYTRADSGVKLSERERLFLRDDLARWYGHTAQVINSRLGYFRRMARFQANDWYEWGKRVLRDVKDNEDYWAPSLSTDQMPSIDNAFRDIEPPPSPRGVGNLGFFGFSAKWLVAQGSLTLALLFGTLGFGMIGSVVARAIAPQSTGSAEAPPRGGGDTLLVGVTAAMIIFLAAQGGLAVIAGNGPAINPYILFLAGLVGAAFGDRIWEAARLRLLKEIADTDKEKEEQAATGEGSEVGEGPNGRGQHDGGEQQSETEKKNEEEQVEAGLPADGEEVEEPREDDKEADGKQEGEQEDRKADKDD